MLNPRAATPLYEKLRTILQRQIDEGRCRPDEAIPSERVLCRQYRISRITVRQAIAQMINAASSPDVHAERRKRWVS